MRCKICQKKVFDDPNKFKCMKCTKACHYTCMDNPDVCPRCQFNMKLKKFQRNYSMLKKPNFAIEGMKN